ncbi:MAG: hypothetical protein J1F33_04600 [Clostridiales bacterium]|nr:hypothetical protein [Clostridiales bacterium]
MGFTPTLLGANALPAIALLSVESFSETTVWTVIVQIFILIGALLIGNILRRVIPFMRKSLVPSALLGGTIVLLLKLIPAVDKFISNDIMEIITYHCLALGFIATALKKNNGNRRTTTKAILESGVLQGGAYSLQASIGLAVTIILSVTAGFPLAAGGVLLALGYGQGTGQALNYGKIYENDFGFTGGTTFGLSVAAIGFFVASIVGVVYLNILRRRGKLKVISSEDRIEKHRLEDFVSANEIPNAESVDKFTINFALVLLIYGIVYGIMRLVNVNLIWGFNFLLGSLLALLVRLLINFLSKKRVIKREPTNNYLLDRISGFMFDMMIIAGVAAIDWNQFSSLWWQLIIICTLGAVATFIYIRFVSNNIYKGYEHEGFISMFGMMTGTASNGMILLREIDPKLETPAASNMVYSGLPAIAFGGGLLLLLNYCPNGLTESLITLAILVVATVVFNLILFRNKIFKRKKKAAVIENTAEGADSAGKIDADTDTEKAAETTETEECAAVEQDCSSPLDENVQE